jgi:hypothetical protein
MSDLDDLPLGARVAITVTFERVPDFTAPFQWRHYDVMIDEPPTGWALGVPCEAKARIIAVRRTLQ